MIRCANGWSAWGVSSAGSKRRAGSVSDRSKASNLDEKAVEAGKKVVIQINSCSGCYMDQSIGHMRYTSRKVEDKLDGYAGYELLRSRDGQAAVRIASVLYWDACPGFWIETFGTDVPLEILEELIAETKEQTGYK
jgi:hypothetical protein